MSLSRAHNFWAWVNRYSRKKAQDAWLASYADTQCPQCDLWDSDLALTGKSKHSETDPEDSQITILTCGGCAHKSHWLMGAPVPIMLNRPSEGIRDG